MPTRSTSQSRRYRPKGVLSKRSNSKRRKVRMRSGSKQVRLRRSKQCRIREVIGRRGTAKQKCVERKYAGIVDKKINELKELLRDAIDNRDLIDNVDIQQKVEAVIVEAMAKIEAIRVMNSKLEGLQNKQQLRPVEISEFRRLTAELNDENLTTEIAGLQEKYDDAIRPLSAARTEAGNSPRNPIDEADGEDGFAP